MSLSRLPAWALIAAAACLSSPILRAQQPSDLPASVSTEDWAGIRGAYDAGRYSAYAVDGGFLARNPGQSWQTRFDGRGFDVRPERGSWTWGLQLEQYGFAGLERAVDGQAAASADGQRVAYDWDASLQEWYVNDTRGLEHGYTLRERPPQAEAGPLTFTLAVRGDLTPQLQADGLGARFLDCDGATALTYAGLLVFDADGEALPARIERAGDGLRFTIDESAARYPLTIDPAAQQGYFKASNTDSDDSFGYAVAVSGTTVVVAAPNEGSSATGVDGNQADNSFPFSGAVYVFVRNGATWSQQAYIKASNTGITDFFGTSVALSGDTLVVGANWETSNATGVNGDQSNNSLVNAGAAYVFVRNGTTWSQQAYLKASNTDINDFFGSSVAISGETVVVGAGWESSNALGVNGNQNNNDSDQSGAAYVFVRDGTTWSQQAYLKASNTGAADSFGACVAISGGTIAIGSPNEASKATGINGNQLDNSFFQAGAVYIFVRSGSTWSQQAYLKASNTGADDLFGCRIAIVGETLVAGAMGETSAALGVNGNQLDNTKPNAGAAYVFTRSGGTWSQQAYLKASNTDAGDAFGSAVAVSGNVVVVGASGEQSNAKNLNGNQANNNQNNAGAAYLFLRSGATWTQQIYVKASNTDGADFFGSTMALSDDILVVGSPGEDSLSTGINGVSTNTQPPSNSGAAYVLDLDLNAFTTLPSGLAGVNGIPLLAGTGSLVAGSAGSLVLTNAAPTALSMVFTSFTSTPVPFKCGSLVSFPYVSRLLFFTNAAGSIPLAWASWPAGLSGTSLYFQYAIPDAAAVCGVALSNAVRADVP